MIRYFIDGYNFLFCYPSVFDDNREELISFLNEKCQTTKSSITVVFDAHLTDSPWSREKTLGRLKIVFTREGETADHYISDAVNKQSCAVTNDRGLSLHCQSSGAHVISPETFLKKFRYKHSEIEAELSPSAYEVEHYLSIFTGKSKQQKEENEKFEGFSNPELDRLWHLFHQRSEEQ